ncbi:MAG: hypothetical protein MUC85_09120 [Anaerolineales bacterium]|jgi:hypothetical protein|nr:hypothetical protein [Anaerolineales bacterium]
MLAEDKFAVSAIFRRESPSWVDLRFGFSLLQFYNRTPLACRRNTSGKGVVSAILVRALLAAWLTRETRGETPSEFAFHLAIMTLPLFTAWRGHLLCCSTGCGGLGCF